MSLQDITSALPLLNVLFAFGIVPLIKSINGLNSAVEKLVLRIDFIEKDIVAQNKRIEKDLSSLSERIDRHLTHDHNSN